MTGLQRLIALGVQLLLLSAIVGLLRRRRYRHCYSFAAYFLAVLIPETLIWLWPEHFYRWNYWLLKEAGHALLRFAIAVELGIRTFGAFPGTHASARAGYLVVTVATCVVVLGVTLPGNQDSALGHSPGFTVYTVLAGQVLPRVLNGTVWLFTVVAMLILWYRLPVSALHKAILIGFVPYLLIFTVAQGLLDAVGWSVRERANYAYTAAYLVLLAYWNLAIWRLDRSGRLATNPATPERSLEPLDPRDLSPE